MSQEQPTTDDLLDSYLGITEETEQAELDDREEDEIEDTAEGDAEEVEAEGEGDENPENPEAQAEPEAVQYADVKQKVKLDDGTEVTVSDLIQGNMRDGDYRKKTAEVAEQRREIESRVQSLRQNEYALDLALEISLASVPPEPDQHLLQSNPVAYMQQKGLYDARMEELAKFIQAKTSLAQNQIVANKQAEQELIDSEARRFIEMMPELRDPEKGAENTAAFTNDVTNIAGKYGFNDKDLEKIADHRFLLMAKDLIEYQKILANKPQAMEKVKGKPPLSASKRRMGNNTNGNALDRLKKSGGRDQQALDDILDKFL